MLISNIGQGSIEEIEVGVAGANYGWDVREGTFITTGNFNVLDDLPAGHPSDSFTYPVAQYDHNNNLFDTSAGDSVAITGGPVYRGTGVPQLTGMYFFGDFGTNSGPIFAVDVDGLVQRDDFTNLSNLNDGLLAPFAEVQLTFGGVDKTLLQIITDELGSNPGRTDLRFGVGPDDEIYVLNKRDGVVRKIVSVSGILDGDADRDGDVDGFDFLTWQRNAGKSGDWSDGDFNATAFVDSTDRALWESQYGNTAPLSAVAAVPEPSSLLACLVGAWIVCLSRRVTKTHFSGKAITSSSDSALQTSIVRRSKPKAQPALVGSPPFMAASSDSGDWPSSLRSVDNPVNGDNNNGFRVASIPEPTTSTLALAALCLAMSRRR